MRILRLLLASLVYFVFLYLILTIKYEHNFSSQSISIHFMNKNIYQDVSKEMFLQQTQEFLNNSDSLEDINISLLEELIVDNNYVRKAEVYLDTEDTVNIYIDFREPFVRTLVDNKIYYFDSEQVLLPDLSPLENELIVLSGDLSSVDLDGLFSLVEEIYNNQLLSELIGEQFNNNFRTRKKLFQGNESFILLYVFKSIIGFLKKLPALPITLGSGSFLFLIPITIFLISLLLKYL